MFQRVSVSALAVAVMSTFAACGDSDDDDIDQGDGCSDGFVREGNLCVYPDGDETDEDTTDGDPTDGDNTVDDVSGCTNSTAVNYLANATIDDGSCSFRITFQVDVNGVTDFDSADGVYVHGSWNAFCGTCAAMTDDDGDKIYTLDVELGNATYDYRFLIGSDPVFDEPVPPVCDQSSTSSYAARSLTVANAPQTLAVASFGSCGELALPLAVNDYYVPSGLMGDGTVLGAIVTDSDCDTRAPDAVSTCSHVTYTAGSAGWAGAWWQYPADNWGAFPGLPIPAGATRVSFYAWGAVGGETIKFQVGIQDIDSFHAETTDTVLTTTPTQYTIAVSGLAYGEVRGGFGWVTSAGSSEFYLDAMVWESIAGSPGCTDVLAKNYNAAATSDDGSCLYDVTFAVDMRCAAAFTTANITGPFCSWCADGFSLADTDGDGIWAGTFEFGSGDLEHKFMVDGFSSQEDLVGDGECAPVTDGENYANRLIAIPADLGENLTSNATYGSCEACVPPP